MANAKQLKALRKKYHLGEFRKNRKVYKYRKRAFSMKRKRKSYSRSRSSGTSGIWATILGVGAYVIFEALVKPMLPISGTLLSVGEIAFGLWIARKGGVIGNLGKAMVTLNAYALLKTFIAPMIPNISSSSVVAYGGY
jgi:hypothetical protein